MNNKCLEAVSHTKIKFEEEGKKVIFLNPDQDDCKKYRIDDCVIKEGLRADALLVQSDKASIVIELKGTDVDHACDQIFVTLGHPEIKPLMKGAIGVLVVCARYPRFDGYVRKAKDRCAKMKAGFHVVSSGKELHAARVAAIDGPY